MENIKILQTLYFLSSFFGCLGPNSTAFLIPAEIFPTKMRTIGHAMCAASAKLGALTIGILFAYYENNILRLYISAICSIFGVGITLVFIPEITTLDLKENDKFWDSV